MTQLTNNPQSVNLQSQLNYYFTIQRAPGVTFYCQSVKIPNITLPPAKVPTPSLYIPMIGDHLVYDDLELTFKVTDDLQNWLEIYNWITAIGNPDNTGKNYKILEANPDYAGYGIYSDLQLFTLDSQKNPTYVFTFHHCSPTGLTGPQFGTTDETVKYITSSVRFNYLKYHISLP